MLQYIQKLSKWNLYRSKRNTLASQHCMSFLEIPPPLVTGFNPSNAIRDPRGSVSTLPPHQTALLGKEITARTTRFSKMTAV